MTHQSIARFLLAALCFLQGSATMAIDLSKSHASNPAWTGHARFHVVWQTVTVSLLSMLEIALVLASGPFEKPRFYLGAALAAAPMLSFLIACIGQGLYGGTLANDTGISPLTLKIAGSRRRFDSNLAIEVLALLTLAAIVALYR